MALPGLSTLGMKLSYGVETTAGTKPAAFTLLDRINSIGGIQLSVETIDASAIEDLVSKSVAGRADTGGQFPITVNVTPATIEAIDTMIEAYQGLAGEKQMWFQVSHPSMSDSWFIIAQPPQQIPMPDVNQNELLTVEIQLTIVDYKGLDTKVSPS